MRFIADSSYWVYLVHLPIVFAAADPARTTRGERVVEVRLHHFGYLDCLSSYLHRVCEITPVGWMLNASERSHELYASCMPLLTAHQPQGLAAVWAAMDAGRQAKACLPLHVCSRGPAGTSPDESRSAPPRWPNIWLYFTLPAAAG